MAQQQSLTSTAPKPTGLKYNSTVSHAIAAALKRHGVSEVFGQSLPSMVHLACNALGIRQIAYRQENTGGYMADAYARTTGKVAVVTAQNGPAAAILVPPLAEALKASIPIVALVQEVARDQTDRNAFQELNHTNLFSACAKWVRTVTVASRIEDYIDMAFTAAASGRPGPAVLMLPADLLTEPYVSEAARKQSLGTFPLDRIAPDPERVMEAARLLADAERPLIVAGGGVHSSGGVAALTELQEMAALPVATTVMGKGTVAETHALSLGVVGYFMGTNSRTRHQRELVTEADVVLLVGNRTNQNGTDSWRLYPPGATYIQIDIDGEEIGRNYEASVRLLGDAKLSLEALSAAMSTLDLEKRKGARAKLEATIATGKEKYEVESEAVRTSDRAPIRPERIMQELSSRIGPDDIIVADASYSSIWIANYLTAIKAGSRFLTPRGLAGLGWGLPMAMGAKVGNPDKRVICLVGDGGFAHAWAELETSRRMGLNVTLIVLNNQILGYQKHAEDIKFGAHTDAVFFEPVDHAAIARACGLSGIRVESAADIGTAIDEALGNNHTTLIDVMSDPEAHPPITGFEA
ncbi:MAG: acetolactate synthase-1/2/3 large subunit [Alphaproteobacteria bacterium]|jgi:acetolactate synthase-1/2/3 large subunit